MTRTALPVAELYAVLEREFSRLRPPRCRICTVPLPYYRRPADDVSANWFIGTPQECEHGCHLVVAELLAELWTRYDIDRSTHH